MILMRLEEGKRNRSKETTRQISKAPNDPPLINGDFFN